VGKPLALTLAFLGCGADHTFTAAAVLVDKSNDCDDQERIGTRIAEDVTLSFDCDGEVASSVRFAVPSLGVTANFAEGKCADPPKACLAAEAAFFRTFAFEGVAGKHALSGRTREPCTLEEPVACLMQGAWRWQRQPGCAWLLRVTSQTCEER
jgi:hypothetical protein